jgi:M6 family metalloprotease-like protein
MGTLDGRRFGLLRGLGLLLLLVAVSAGPARAESSVAAPGQAAAGTAVALEGEIEILHEDLNNHSSRYRYFVKTSNGRRLTLHFVKHPPTNLLTGDHVSVHGSQSGTTITLASGVSVANLSKFSKPQPSPTPGPSGPLPNTLGAQSTLVILVNFQDAPTNQPYTVATVQSLVFGTVSSFFLENSYRQTWLTGDVVGWYTIPVSSTTCNITSIASSAQAAASAAGVNLSAYTHFVYAFPQNSACGFAGASNIGGSPSQSWINGSGMEMHTVDHELGHAFGLWHSHLLDCGPGATIGTNCIVNEYGDIIDTMGASQPSSPHYNAFQKVRLGWLNYGTSPSVTAVTAPGTYAINPYELGGSGPNALKILKSTDPTTQAKTWYYVEARQAIGFDGFLTDGTCSSCYTQNETNGVLVHTGTDGDGNSGDLLDMTPATQTFAWWFDPSLAVGQSFVDPATGVTLTTTSATFAGAAVTVQFTGSVTVATNQQTYTPGQTVSTMATATYAGSPVANVLVSFTITKPNGTKVTSSATTGGNGVAVFKLRLARTDPPGTYLAAVATMIEGNPHSANTDFSVQ